MITFNDYEKEEIKNLLTNEEFWYNLHSDYLEKLEKIELDIAIDELYFYALENGISMKEAEWRILSELEEEIELE